MTQTVTGEQALPDMPDDPRPTRITFIGMHAESHADVFELGDPHEFKVAGRVAHWSEFDRGGHFPAMEVPDLLAGDIRAFFAGLN